MPYASRFGEFPTGQPVGNNLINILKWSQVCWTILESQKILQRVHKKSANISHDEKRKQIIQ
jgi:hypothetical protein